MVTKYSLMNSNTRDKNYILITLFYGYYECTDFENLVFSPNTVGIGYKDH